MYPNRDLWLRKLGNNNSLFIKFKYKDLIIRVFFNHTLKCMESIQIDIELEGLWYCIANSTFGSKGLNFFNEEDKKLVIGKIKNFDAPKGKQLRDFFEEIEKHLDCAEFNKKDNCSNARYYHKGEDTKIYLHKKCNLPEIKNKSKNSQQRLKRMTDEQLNKGITLGLDKYKLEQIKKQGQTIVFSDNPDFFKKELYYELKKR